MKKFLLLAIVLFGFVATASALEWAVTSPVAVLTDSANVEIHAIYITGFAVTTTAGTWRVDNAASTLSAVSATTLIVQGPAWSTGNVTGPLLIYEKPEGSFTSSDKATAGIRIESAGNTPTFKVFGKRRF